MFQQFLPKERNLIFADLHSMNNLDQAFIMQSMNFHILFLIRPHSVYSIPNFSKFTTLKVYLLSFLIQWHNKNQFLDGSYPVFYESQCTILTGWNANFGPLKHEAPKQAIQLSRFPSPDARRSGFFPSSPFFLKEWESHRLE